ncbi:protein Star-like [Palaemon carinicauda]|uniref:protein Star-like n=1 Tax=Palaemon carinicauda TaxID=392227 RepID=UPI0035B5D4C7
MTSRFRLNGLIIGVVVGLGIFFFFGSSLQKSVRSNLSQMLDCPSMKSERYVTMGNYQGLDQEDPALIHFIRVLMRPPSTKPYNLRSPGKKYFTMGYISKYVGNLFGPGKRKGFFVEVGANDGETSSVTMYLERELGFNGLLIEGSPRLYEQVVKKERKAYSIQAALSPTRTSEELLFAGGGQQGHLVDEKSKNSILVPAFPFYSILRAINVSFIDVFSLDIEGFEYKVLKTIPFEKIKVGVFVVEYTLMSEPREEMVEFMDRLGYKKIHDNKMDYVFADPDYLRKLPGWNSQQQKKIR